MNYFHGPLHGGFVDLRFLLSSMPRMSAHRRVGLAS